MDIDLTLFRKLYSAEVVDFEQVAERWVEGKTYAEVCEALADEKTHPAYRFALSTMIRKALRRATFQLELDSTEAACGGIVTGRLPEDGGLKNPQLDLILELLGEYQERFGLDAHPTSHPLTITWMCQAGEAQQALVKQIREALRTGKPIKKDDLPDNPGLV